MNRVLFYVGDDQVDLLPKTVIATTIKKIQAGNLPARNVNFTNSFDIPWTENNARIFGFAFDERSRSSVPYQFLSCRLVQNGIETIPDGRCYITKPTKKKVTVNIYENIIDFFKSVNELSLYDINPIADSAWDAAGIDAARTNTSGIVTAVLHWGKSGAIYQVNFFLPCFYYHSIISAILQKTGLTVSGSILTDARFKDLVIPFPGTEFLYPQNLVDAWIASGYNSSNPLLIGQVLTGIRVVQLNAFNYGSSLFSSSFYISPDYVNVTVTMTIEFTAFTWNLATFLEIEILKNSVTVMANYTVAGGTGSTSLLTLTFTGSLNPSDTIHLNLRSDQASVPNGVDCTVAQNWTFKVDANRTINRSSVMWSELWPKDIKCKDILKDFFTRFALVPKLVGQTLYLKTLEEICSDRANAVDWSSKLVNRDAESINLSLGYAQNNHFLHKDMDEVGQEDLGRGTIVIANELVEENKTVFTSVFGNSLITNISSYRVATIPVYDADSTGIDTFGEEPGLRILTLKARTSEAAITFNAVSRTDYKLAYFVDPTQTKDTGFQYFLDQFYPSLESSLQFNKVSEKFFLLTELDIAALDPFKMVWDGTSFSIAETVDKFIPSKITRVNLFKVS